MLLLCSGQPLDTLKVRAQLATPGQFNGTWDIAKQTVQKEGFFALQVCHNGDNCSTSITLTHFVHRYKGMASPLVGIAAVNGLLFGAYVRAKKLVSPYPVLTLPQTAAAGAIAGAINSILASPVELFKIRMQGKHLKSVRGESA